MEQQWNEIEQGSAETLTNDVKKTRSLSGAKSERRRLDASIGIIYIITYNTTVDTYANIT